MAFSLRDFQKAALIRMFKLSGDDEDDVTSSEDKPSWSAEWKILVYDADARAVISPLLTVGELRSLGVTLHLNIDAPRDIIPDVAAVYFVRPSSLNIRYIADDAAAARYREFQVNFITPIPRPLLETFARSCVEGGAVPRVRRVQDQYLSFVALESRLFHLNMRDSYAAYARNDATDADITAYARSVALGLLGVCGTAALLPIIIAQPGGPAALVAEALNALIQDHLSSPGSGIFGHSASALAAGAVLPGGRRPVPLALGQGGRPALLLMDRDLDLATPLAHSSSYASLVDDTLGPLSLNRVVVPEDGSAMPGSGSAGGVGWLGDILGGGQGAAGKGKAKGRPITLDSESDAFWRAHACDEFPVAIEAHEAELRDTQAREAAIRRTAGATADADDALASAALGVGGQDSSASDLVSAIDSLPALLKRRKVLESHATLLSGVMERVAARLLPHFYDVEAPGLLAGSSAIDRASVYEMVRDGSKGSVEDRGRLGCVYLLSCPLGVPGAAGGGGARSAADDARFENEALEAALRNSVAPPGAENVSVTAPPQPVAEDLERSISALKFAMKVRALASSNVQNVSTGGAGSAFLGMAAAAAGAVGQQMVSGGAGGRLLEGMARATTTMLSKAAAQVSRLVGGEARLPVTRMVAAVCEGRLSGSGTGIDGYIVLDPRAGPNVRPMPFASFLASQQAAAQATANSQAPSAGPGFRAVLSFVVGGGSYSEYVDCQRYAAAVSANGAAAGGRGGSATVVYGATEMLHPKAFLKTMASFDAQLSR